MQNVKNTIVNRLLSAISPHPCPSCGETSGELAECCESYIQPVPYGACRLCSKKTPRSLCPACGDVVEDCLIVGQRTGVLQQRIDDFKFHGSWSSHFELVRLLHNQISPHAIANMVVVPVPTVSAHVRVRGYDHCELLGRRLSKALPCLYERVVETASHHTQHKLDRHERALAAGDAYSVAGAIDASKAYVIVDDIVTTGATILSVAKSLRAAGARRVYALVIAKQPLD